METFYKSFWKLDQALQFNLANAENRPGLRVWAFESPNALIRGTKKFFSVTKETFWQQYCEVVEPHRHCRLFFDIDVSRNLNPHFDGRKSIRIFISFVRLLLAEM